MFKRKTVFILGAGVSAQFGFPAGHKVVQYIAKGCDLKTNVGTGEVHTEIPTNPFLISNLAEAVAQAQPRSIDAFLENRPDLQDVGKLVLAHYIGSHEIPDQLNIDENCLQLILEKMVEDCRPEDVCRNQVSFITFNYDRSLEHFFHTALRARYQLDDDAAAKWLSEIPIVHVYGQLGYLPWQQKLLSTSQSRQHELFDRNMGVRHYVADMRPQSAGIAMRGIEIISLAHPESPTLRFCRSLLEGASMIIMLGFGYLRENMERLGLSKSQRPEWSNNKVICGSSYDFTTAERHAINRRYHVEFTTDTGNAYSFLRNLPDFVDM